MLLMLRRIVAADRPLTVERLAEEQEAAERGRDRQQHLQRGAAGNRHELIGPRHDKLRDRHDDRTRRQPQRGGGR